ncbi:fimbria/pilus periplasmic chaperone [Edwardsiella tarda]|uniref:fimbria/pilus periplasmic chaperone n=1 Tax=Edwardsiella tarda TaxID=636 RepID=UPI00063BEBD5|nr:fimbria/pilus periplasmic chaperone [Edwardsiella tarda]AKH88326.1 fimbria/pilus periplasmic chaperone [Edwardsiella tarda]ATI64920.1 molecular chaperone [Edwardsiella tarda]UCQ28462.1 fimbria/pilus periplasmic chaperone [Edwardsiella tarda]WGE29786.1 fimbria/pilus periplasmic chaperone [Edwardsiella tarda]
MIACNKLLIRSLISVVYLASTCSAYAAISLDRTRAIFNGAENSMSLNIANDNKQLPYLAQAWLEDEHGKKITIGPLIVTPPVQRVEPGAKSIVRVSATPAINELPQDRESLFYFNLREIPPKSEKQNVLQIALQTKIKLFYRPKQIMQSPNAVWQNKLVLNKVNGGYRIQNPTPYFITIIGFGGNKLQSESGEFDAVMLSPKSEKTIKSGNYAVPYLTYINDYGGRPTLKFQCKDSRCIVDE